MTIQTENEYEDLLGLWSDLEAGLGIILSRPASIQEFEKRVWQYDRWMQGLLARDTDVGLYLLFQLAINSPVGYSASHALVSAVLCHLIAVELKLPQGERDSLVHVAMTMNMAMTALQDQLASQLERPSPAQQEAIRSHAIQGVAMLTSIGVQDALWLTALALHHDDSTDHGDLRTLPPERRLARILRLVDRYAAMISPRKSREGRSATDSARAIITQSVAQNDEVGHVLVRVVGLCPPGTYVRLDNQEVAVVVRRSSTPNQPILAIVTNPAGMRLNPPRLHRSADGGPGIRAAVSASNVHDRLNHHLILQLGQYAALHP
ncbi:MAG: phosphodiesterase [Gammaproteobacteria bacterium]|uniref:HD-GYP domain-containing protein n=1 Tax=Rhodoferax sp. TaxID=50421 RepID=UPI0017D8CA27|nr:phosphodiesterase [Rhodoferax sp.]MBU3898930.1 phosphodiesterase [Gammaproteobacteria bacterium]MBA3059277.1 phosphodiesterase [Rhodoferax sp.]MBU3997521.1 phosphodiesterase [Gammaproteobacteria bacterium]MBU4018373.1 phosphodiesterase [Gammaproteobacteria bacterium]MBU4080386.1 phosphodiesterase [Gammaproteobacteria bacterium]